MDVWVWVGFAGLALWLIGLVWLVHRLDRDEEPYVDPYDWQ